MLFIDMTNQHLINLQLTSLQLSAFTSSFMNAVNEIKNDVEANNFILTRPNGLLTVCMNTEYESKAPTKNSDRECKALTVCKQNEYESKPPVPGKTDRECKLLNMNIYAKMVYNAYYYSGFEEIGITHYISMIEGELKSNISKAELILGLADAKINIPESIDDKVSWRREAEQMLQIVYQINTSIYKVDKVILPPQLTLTEEKIESLLLNINSALVDGDKENTVQLVTEGLNATNNQTQKTISKRITDEINKVVNDLMGNLGDSAPAFSAANNLVKYWFD